MPVPIQILQLYVGGKATPAGGGRSLQVSVQPVTAPRGDQCGNEHKDCSSRLHCAPATFTATSFSCGGKQTPASAQPW